MRVLLYRSSCSLSNSMFYNQVWRGTIALATSKSRDLCAMGQISKNVRCKPRGERKRRIMAQLETDRLLLREFVREDWAAVHRYGSDPEVSRYIDWGPNTEADTSAFMAQALAVQRAQPRPNFQFAVVLKREGRLIGACTLEFTDISSREAALGYIYERAAWGQGYAIEAARAML